MRLKMRRISTPPPYGTGAPKTARLCGLATVRVIEIGPLDTFDMRPQRKAVRKEAGHDPTMREEVIG